MVFVPVRWFPLEELIRVSEFGQSNNRVMISFQARPGQWMEVHHPQVEVLMFLK